MRKAENDLMSAWPDVVEKVKKSVLRIEVENGFGTGIAITEQRLITNAHVVGNQKNPKVIDFGGQSAVGMVVWYSSESDLAVLS